jgi:hypothetical protein
MSTGGVGRGRINFANCTYLLSNPVTVDKSDKPAIAFTFLRYRSYRYFPLLILWHDARPSQVEIIGNGVFASVCGSTISSA